ncbi:GTP-binding protein, putative, partial [Bodo saltans]
KNPDGEDLTFPDEVAKEFLELRQTSHRDVWGELPPFPIFVLRAKAYREDDAHGLHEFVMKSSDYFTAGHKRAYIRSQIVSDELKQSACADIIASAVKASVACGLSPVPFSSALLLIPIEVRMIIRICSVYELELDDTAVLCIAGIVTGTLAVTALFPSNAVKTIPLFGSVLGGICEAVVAAAACRVVGEATVLAVNLVRTQLGTALLRSAPVATWFPIVHRVLIATIKRQYQNADLPMDPVAPPAE